MRRSMMFGVGILCIATLIGCGGGDDAVAKDMIAVLDEEAALYQKVLDAKTTEDAKKLMDEMKSSLEKIAEKSKEINKKMEGWTKERKDAFAERKDVKDATVKNFNTKKDAALKAVGAAIKLPF